MKENGIVKQKHTTIIQQAKKNTVALWLPRKTARARNTNRSVVEQMLITKREVSIGFNRHAGTMPTMSLINQFKMMKIRLVHSQVNITEAIACRSVDILCMHSAKLVFRLCL